MARFEMTEVLGKPWSAWGGAINVLSMPTALGRLRYRYFLPDEINTWGTQGQRISQVLAWVTSNTNLRRLRDHVRPEGVAQLSLRRRMDQMREKSAQMDVAQLRQALDEASKQTASQEAYFNELVEENAGVEADLSRYRDDLDDARDEIRTKDFQIQTLKEQLARAGNRVGGDFDAEALLGLRRRRTSRPRSSVSMRSTRHMATAASCWKARTRARTA
jgi:hypothetical protein